MKIKIVSGIVLMVVLFLLLPEPEISSTLKPASETKISQGKEEASNHFIIRNVRVYDGDKVIENTDLWVKNNHIAALEKNIKNKESFFEIDGSGKTLIPGLIDAHTHAWGSALEHALNFGVTTELDMFTMPEYANSHQSRRDDIENINQADLFSATILATAPKGHGTEYGMEIPVLTDAAQAEAFVEQRIADGADYIKVVYDAAENAEKFFPSISREILRALARAAQSKDKLLLVHVDNLISARHALLEGANGLVHSFMDDVVDDSFIQLMRERKAFMIPTLSVESSVVGTNRGKMLVKDAAFEKFITAEQEQQLHVNFPDFDRSSLNLKNAMRSVLLLQRAGVPILAGSDAPNPGTSHGISLHGELELLVEAGLTPQQALHAATGSITRNFPVEHRGTLKIGAPASMLLIDGNPLVDIGDTRKIEIIWKNGVQYQRKKRQEKAALASAFPAGLITDFNRSETQTSVGLGISPTSDQLAGGKSEVIIKHTKKAEGAEDSFLKVAGHIKSGFIYPWGGVAYTPGKSPNQGVDLQQLKYLVFDAKGSAKSKQISVLVFQAGSFQPSTQAVQLSNDWQTYRVELSVFSSVDHRWINNISIVAGGGLGAFEFSIDNLKLE